MRFRAEMAIRSADRECMCVHVTGRTEGISRFLCHSEADI